MAKKGASAARSQKRTSKDFRLPHLTCNNVCETVHENGFKVLCCPVNRRSEFRWFDIPATATAFNMPVEPDQTLYVRRSAEALKMLESDPDCCVLVHTTSKKMPPELKPYADRVIQVACRNEEERERLLAAVTEIFLTMLRWENRLNFIMETRGSLEGLLSIGAEMLSGFSFVVGVDYHIVGYSAEGGFPNREYKQMFEEERRLTPSVFSSIAGQHEESPARDAKGDELPEVTVTQDEWGNHCMVIPMRYHSSLFGYLVVVRAPDLPVLPGMCDQFRHYARYVISLCEFTWQTGVEKDLPHYYFLTSLLRGESFTNATIEASLNRLGIPQQAWFKVVVCDPTDSRQGTDVLADALRSLNDKRSYVVLFEDRLAAILYTEQEDGVMSHRHTLEDLEKFLYGPYGIVCGISQVFGKITDVRLGFRQAVYALANREAINVEASLLSGEPPLQGISFEMAQPYFTIREHEVDKEFHEFCLSYSPLEKLLEHDLDNASHEFALLWYFLSYERNASLVGRRMFMHRNSVLYHVRQIEKRFDLDLDDWYVREKLLMDYRFLFMRLTDETIEKLFFSM